MFKMSALFLGHLYFTILQLDYNNLHAQGLLGIGSKISYANRKYNYDFIFRDYFKNVVSYTLFFFIRELYLKLYYNNNYGSSK
jgi:hypothetical protein